MTLFVNVIEWMMMMNTNRLRDIGLTQEEEIKFYNNQLDDLYRRPRWYLDNLEYLHEYRLSWVDYKVCSITSPFPLRKNDKSKGL